MATRIKKIEFDAEAMQQMIINSFNLMDSEEYDFVKIPVGLAGDRVINIQIEPLKTSEEGDTFYGCEIPYDAREECLGKMKDSVTLIIK